MKEAFTKLNLKTVANEQDISHTCLACTHRPLCNNANYFRESDDRIYLPTINTKMSHIRQSEVQSENGNIFYKVDLHSFNSVVMLSVEEYDELIDLVKKKVEAFELTERSAEVPAFEVENGAVYYGEGNVTRKISDILEHKLKRLITVIEWIKNDAANHYYVRYKFDPIPK